MTQGEALYTLLTVGETLMYGARFRLRGGDYKVKDRVPKLLRMWKQRTVESKWWGFTFIKWGVRFCGLDGVWKERGSRVSKIGCASCD